MNGLIQSIFPKSPLKPLVKHICKVHECCSQLVPFFEAVFSDNWEAAQTAQQSIKAMEKEADKIKMEIRMKLPTGLFMPFARTDLLELVSQQDKIANRAKDIAGIVLGRHLHVPKDIENDFLQYIRRCLDATLLATKVISELENLLEIGFKGKEVKVVEKMVEDLDVIESDTDNIQIEIRHSLYQRESELNPIDAIFLYDILNKIGDLADQAERIGTKLEVMVGRA
jgi:predicted phosphate transport protein (TIGR00153 family)